MKSNEQKIYGRNACLAFAKKYPEAVIRAYCNETTQKTFGFLLKKLAQQKKAYHLVTNAELNKISESDHHEGVVLLIERPALIEDSDVLKKLRSLSRASPQCILCLDGVSNPHNLGSIVRTAAHFNIRWIILFNVDSTQQKSLSSGAFHRSAEGGAVCVDVGHAAHPANFLKALTSEFGFTVAMTTSHARGRSLHHTKLPPRLALVMGSESHGVSRGIEELAQLSLCIEGTGNVESLNVSCASAILLNEYVRQTQRKPVFKDGPSTSPTLAGREDGRKRRGS
jgi:TrmH RNA methyltransferase